MKNISKYIGNLSLAEKLLLGANAILLVILAFSGHDFILTDASNFWMVIALGFFFIPYVKLVKRLIHRKEWFDEFKENIILSFRSSFFFYMMVTFHFNFKSYIPILHNNNFDDILLQSDRYFSWYIEGVTVFREWLNATSGEWVNGVYLWGYLLLFVVTFMAFHYAKDRETIRQMMDSVYLISFIGTISYIIMPALGPFIYTGNFHLEHFVLWKEVVISNDVTPSYLFASLGAMPSLHAAHAVGFWYMAHKYYRKLLIFIIPMTIWIFIDAVYLQWHYVIDLIVGVAIAFIALFFIGRLYETGRVSGTSKS